MTGIAHAELDRRRPLVALAALGLACVGFMALLAGGGTEPAAGQNRATGATLVTVTAGKPSEFAFKLSRSSGLPTGTITFKVKNAGVLVHTFKVCTAPIEAALTNACAGKSTATLQPGRSSTLAVTFGRSGTYEYLSSVAGQAAKGMRGLIGIGVTLPKATTTPGKTTTPSPSKPTAPTAPTPSPTPSTSPSPSTDAAAGAALFESLGCTSCHSLSSVQASGTVTASLNATHTGGPFSNGPLTVAQIALLAAAIN